MLYFRRIYLFSIFSPLLSDAAFARFSPFLRFLFATYASPFSLPLAMPRYDVTSFSLLMPRCLPLYAYFRQRQRYAATSAADVYDATHVDIDMRVYAMLPLRHAV